MNRFRTKRKAKKGQVESKPELDLATALPSTDNFRTSLIMPNLSARFSMLREQDDPNSKLGKASDDSVLQPKRQSRLPDFGFRAGLSDIAEVSSINSSIRPPFAYGRQDSVGSGDGYGTDEDCAYTGNVMSRARPGEGNVLFGGRQKIYKIPAGPSASTRSLGNVPGGGMSGKALYDDDVGMSAFQKLRQQARQDERDRQEDNGSTYTEQSSPAQALTYSSSISDSTRRRETTCSTNSGPSLTRSSTAATSIASQGPNAITPSPTVPSSHMPPAQNTTGLERSATTKARRLYEQGLDQHIQEQQSSTMTRLNSVQRQRMLNGTMTPPYLSQTKSTSSLSDPYRRARDIYRATSPPPSAPLPNLVTLNTGSNTNSSASSPIASLSQSPPLSPAAGTDAVGGNVLSSAIQPSDRGKATAMGAFNKPKQFDEQQYLQRQLQLQRGRTVAPPINKIANPSVTQTVNEVEHLQAIAGASRSPDPDPSAQSQPTAFSVFQKAASRMRSKSSPTHEAASAPDIETTFLASLDGSESKDDMPLQISASRPAADHSSVEARTPVIPPNQVAPPILDHPALRELNPQPSYKNALATPQVQVQPAEYVQQSVAHSKKSFGPSVRQPDMQEVDSPTLGPTDGGLSGLVRQHLRSTSNQSSIYSNSPMTLSASHKNDLSLSTEGKGSTVDTTVRSSYTHSNPWDLEDLDGAYCEEADVINSASPGNAQGKSHATYGVNRVVRNGSRHALDEEADMANGAPWERELRKQHSRGASTETQQEREAFLNEVAQRQRAIQESLKSKVEGEVRSQSPTAGMTGAFKAFGMLRAKSSRDSVAPKQDPPLKAMKMLGLGGNSTSASNGSLLGLERSSASESWRREMDGGSHEASRLPTVRPLQTRVQSDGDQRKQQGSRNVRSTERANSKSRSPPSSNSSMRKRSSSEISGGRSRSRSGRYRDDLEKAMTEATGSRSNAYSKTSPAIPGHPPDGQASSERTQQHIPTSSRGTPAQSPRLRSNSRTPAPSYFDQSLLHPVHTAHENASSTQLSISSLSPGPASRVSPTSNSPSLLSSRPPPIVAPYSASSTPPLSTATTPIGSVFASTTMSLTRLPTHRKQSIKKSDISEPTLISMTSVVDTVDLPPGASLKNGQADPSPLPQVNPLRKRFGFGRSESQEGQTPRPSASESSNSPTEENEKCNRPTQKLRKTSSEGWSLNAKARKPASVPASPSLSQYTNGFHTSSPQQVEGAMF